MAQRSIGKRQKYQAVLELLNKLIQKKKGRIYILDLDKSNNLPVFIQNKNEAQSLAIAYYQLLTNCFTSSKKAKEQFKALFICNIEKCNFGTDQKADRRFRADKNMLVNGKPAEKEQIVQEYFNDCFRKLAAQKKQTEEVLSNAKETGDIGQAKEQQADIDLKDIADIHTDPDVPGGNIDDDQDDFESSYGGDGQDYLDDEDFEQQQEQLDECDQKKGDKPIGKLTPKELEDFKKKINDKNNIARKNIKDLKKSKNIKEDAAESNTIQIKIRDFLKWLCDGQIHWDKLIDEEKISMDGKPIKDLNIYKKYFLYYIGQPIKFTFTKTKDGYDILFQIRKANFSTTSKQMYKKKIMQAFDRFTYKLYKYKDILDI